MLGAEIVVDLEISSDIGIRYRATRSGRCSKGPVHGGERERNEAERETCHDVLLSVKECAGEENVDRERMEVAVRDDPETRSVTLKEWQETRALL